MSNEQLMQEELKKAVASVDEVTTDELSDEELKAVAGGYRPICIKRTVCLFRTRRPWPCIFRTRRYSGDE